MRTTSLTPYLLTCGLPDNDDEELEAQEEEEVIVRDGGKHSADRVPLP